MIKNKKDLRFYLEADRIALGIKNPQGVVDIVSTHIQRILFPNYIWKYEILLRKCEYYTNIMGGGKSLIVKPLLYVYKIRFHRLSYKLMIHIPLNRVGPGLALTYGSIVINSKAKIGSNCRIHCRTHIGSAAGKTGASPVIGNNCYIGPGAKLFGSINIPNNTAIGANAVVNKSFFEENTVLAGIPAVVKKNKTDIRDFLVQAVPIVKLGMTEMFDNNQIDKEVLKQEIDKDKTIYDC